MSKQYEAQEALFEAIKVATASVPNANGVAARAAALRDLALAYRYAAGGAQPGGVNVEK